MRKGYTKRRLVAGVGINDADYIVTPTVNGEQDKCPFYVRWSGMIKRCYDASTQKRKPSYVGCSVCPEWHTFSNFKAWMEKQDWVGKELDKDILVAGNKIYSPETCAFVSKRTNTVMELNLTRRGDYPLGVTKTQWGFCGMCRTLSGASINLGTFDTPEEAHLAWQWEKAGVLWALSKQQDNPRVANALSLRAGQLVDDALSGKETKW